ncbi:prominin-1-A-like isoform X2 [Pelodiscus sinensis]
MACRRRALFVSVLLVTTFILAGNICAFISNDRVSRAVSGSFGTLNATLDNLAIFVRSVPQQVDFILDASDGPVNRANGSLQAIGPTLGGRIVTALGHEAYGALDSATLLLAETGRVEQALRAVNASGQRLQELQEGLRGNLSRLQGQLNRTLQRCGPPCANVSSGGLAPEADFTRVPDVSHQLELLSNLSKANLSAALQQANRTLSETPLRVEQQAQEAVADARRQLGEVRGALGRVRSEIPALDTLGDVAETLGKVGRNASQYEPQVTTYDHYRWIVGVCLCCLVLCVVLCNLLGLALGAVGLQPAVLPIERSCLSNSGGQAFLAGVGFSFLFSWLLMLLVLVSFLLGGNAYTLVCQPWHSRQLLQSLETSGLAGSFNLSEMLGLPGGTVTLSGVYNNCQHDQPLWSTLQLDKAVSLDQLLNISQYTGEITAAFEQLNISLSPVTFLSQSQKQLLSDISTSGLQLNFTGTLQQLARKVTQRDLLPLALQLEGLANATDNLTLRMELKQEAADLRDMDGQIQALYPPEMQALNGSIWILQAATPQLPARINATLQSVAAAQTFLDSRAADVVRNESRAFLQTLLGYFQSYIAWAKSTLKGQVGRCGRVARTVDVAGIVACSYIVDSLNGFWFSLGWCTISLLPSIVLAVRLAKFYRRMETADVYDSDQEALEMASSTTQFKIPRVETRQ